MVKQEDAAAHCTELLDSQLHIFTSSHLHRPQVPKANHNSANKAHKQTTIAPKVHKQITTAPKTYADHNRDKTHKQTITTPTVHNQTTTATKAHKSVDNNSTKGTHADHNSTKDTHEQSTTKSRHTSRP